MTLYEVDDAGWVFRQVQLCSEGSRFAPEDILMCHPVNVDAMVRHPAAEEIGGEEFELLWGELAPERDFYARLPDPRVPWCGEMIRGDVVVELQWLPGGFAPGGWTRVPGFETLFVRGSRSDARAACAAVFMDRPIRWVAMSLAA